MTNVEREQPWIDPDWKCPRCQYMNLAIRNACRNCGHIGGEFQIIEWAALEVTEEAGQ